MFCTKCGANLPDGSSFCTKCGNKLGGGQPVVQEVQISPEVLYKNAGNLMQVTTDNQRLLNAINLYKKLGDYEDAKEKIKTCIDYIYNNINNVVVNSNNVEEIQKAIVDMGSIEADVDIKKLRVEACYKKMILTGYNVLNNDKVSKKLINATIADLETIKDYEGVGALIEQLHLKAEKTVGAKEVLGSIAFMLLFFVLLGGAGFCGYKAFNKYQNNGFKVEARPTNYANYLSDICIKLYKDGVPVTNKYIDYNGIKVPADANGVLRLNCLESDNKGLCYYDEKGKKVVDVEKTIKLPEGTYIYYFDSNGYMLTGGFNNKKHYFREQNAPDGKPAGSMVVDTAYICSDGNSYIFNSDGFILDNKKGMQQVGSNQYFIKDDNTIANDEFVEQNGKKYYIDNTGKMLKEDWKEAYNNRTGKNEWYYFDKDGVAVTGEQMIGGNEYLFGDDFYIKKDEWVEKEVANADTGTNMTKWVYYGSDGKKVKNGVSVSEGVIYAFDKDGYMIDTDGAYQLSNGLTYFVNSSGQVKVNQVVQYNGKGYYLDMTGQISTNAPYELGLYFNDDGSIFTDGWQGDRFYSAGSPFSGEFNGTYFDNGYVMRNKWYKNFWIDSNGHMAKNQWVDGNKYYVGANGAYLVNQIAPDGSGKYLGADGKVMQDVAATSKTNTATTDTDTVDTTTSDIILLNKKYNVTYNGVPVEYYSVTGYNAINKEKQASLMQDAEESVESEILDYIEELCNDSPKPKDIKLSKWSPGTANNRTAKLSAKISVKKSDGKSAGSNKKITIEIDMDTEQYTIDWPDIDLE